MDILEAADVLNAGFLSWSKRTGKNFQDGVKTFLEDYFLFKFSSEPFFLFIPFVLPLSGNVYFARISKLVEPPLMLHFYRPRDYNQVDGKIEKPAPTISTSRDLCSTTDLERKFSFL